MRGRCNIDFANLGVLPAQINKVIIKLLGKCYSLGYRCLAKKKKPGQKENVLRKLSQPIGLKGRDLHTVHTRVNHSSRGVNIIGDITREAILYLNTLSKERIIAPKGTDLL